MHVGSRFCNGATAYFTDVQLLTKAAVVGDHNRQHPTLLLLLGGVSDTHVGYSELQSLAPPWLSSVCLGSGAKGQPRRWWWGWYLVPPLGMNHGALMKQGSPAIDECCEDQNEASLFVVVAALSLCTSSHLRLSHTLRN